MELEPPDDNAMVLHPQDAIELMAAGLLSAAADGKRKISSLALYSTSSTSFPSDPGFDPDEKFEIPEQKESPQTFEFLGYTPTQAAILWHRWLDVPTTDQDEGGTKCFLDIATANITDSGLDAEGMNDDWVGVMTRWGIEEKLQQGIIDPEFEDLRGTGTAVFWVVDSMQTRQRALRDIADASRLRQRHRQQKAGNATKDLE